MPHEPEDNFVKALLIFGFFAGCCWLYWFSYSLYYFLK